MRGLQKKVAGQASVIGQYEGQLKGFAQQAKDQYRKYEEYLEGAEDVALYAAVHARRALGLLEASLDGALLGSPFALADFRDPEESREGGPELEARARAVLGRFAGSDFLKRKKLFLNLKQRLDFRERPRAKEMQYKYDRLLEIVTRDQAGAPGKKPERNRNITETLLVFTEDAQNRSVSNQESQEARDENISHLLLRTGCGLGQLRDAFRANAAFSADADSLKDLFGHLNELVDAVSGYCFSFKDGLARAVHFSDKARAPAHPSIFNEQLEGLKRHILEVERLEYARLHDLRDKNDKLSIIQDHIKT